MKMKKINIPRLADLCAQIYEIVSTNNGIISIEIDDLHTPPITRNKMSVHLMEDTFFEVFDDKYGAADLKNPKYIRYSVLANGVEFFCLSKREDKE